MRQYRTIDEIVVEYLSNHPDKIELYIIELFENYAQDLDTEFLLSSLFLISRAFGQRPIIDALVHKPIPRAVTYLLFVEFLKSRPGYFRSRKVWKIIIP